MITVVLFAAAALGTAFLVLGAGYLVHWLAHRPETGALYRGHMVHHTELYPPGAFLSERYLSPPASKSFVLAFLPFAVSLVLAAFLMLPRWLAVLVTIETAIIGWASNYLHDAFHVQGFWLERLQWFGRLRRLHVQHHDDMRTNLGIFLWLWDRLLGTFHDPEAVAPKLDAIAPPRWEGEPVPAHEFLVAVAVAPPSTTEPGHILVSAVAAADAESALRACGESTPGVIARHVAPLEGEVLALWNELGRAAFGFGQ